MISSDKYLNKIKALPGRERKTDLKELTQKSAQTKSELGVLDALIGASLGSSLYVKHGFNVEDEVFEAYGLANPNLSIDTSLYEKVLEEQGTEGIAGLISNLKGKLFEIELEGNLESMYPGYDFSIAEKANQPIWDLIGEGPDGTEILVQAKMVNSESASDIYQRMIDNPDVFFATSNEVREKVLENSPELADQFIPVDVNNLEFTDQVGSELDQLLENAGIDVPDDIADVVPIVGEIVIGLRLLYELSQVKKNFGTVKIDDKRRIKGLKAIMLLSKFGVTAVVATIGAAGGSAIFPGVGTVLGGVGGAVAGMVINKKIKPRLHEFALYLLDMTEEDLIYFRNKKNIDEIAKRFNSRRLKFAS